MVLIKKYIARILSFSILNFVSSLGLSMDDTKSPPTSKIKLNISMFKAIILLVDLLRYPLKWLGITGMNLSSAIWFSQQNSFYEFFNACFFCKKYWKLQKKYLVSYLHSFKIWEGIKLSSVGLIKSYSIFQFKIVIF